MTVFMSDKEEEIKDLLEYAKKEYIMFPKSVAKQIGDFLYSLDDDEYELCNGIAETIISKLPLNPRENVFDYYEPTDDEKDFLMEIEDDGLMQTFSMYLSLLTNYKMNLKKKDPNKMS